MTPERKAELRAEAESTIKYKHYGNNGEALHEALDALDAAEARVAKLEDALEKIASGRTGFFGASLIPSSQVARKALEKP